MKQWLVRIVLLVILAAAGIWVWGILFPNPERQIRKRLAEVAQAASFSGKEAPAAQAYNSQLLTTFCTDDVEVMVDFPGRSHYTVHGRDELLTGAMAARGFANGLSVEFLDINITVAPDHQTAVADLTAKGKVPGEREILAQELKMKLKKIGRNWFIQKIETVKSLSQKSLKPQASSIRETKNCKIQKSHSPLVVFLSKSDLKFGYWRFPEACVLKFEAFPA
jgi:hypothetical protein